MAIDASLPVSREIALASAVPQASLTRRDRELQVSEGLPPIEVTETGMEALRWRKSEGFFARSGESGGNNDAPAGRHPKPNRGKKTKRQVRSHPSRSRQARSFQRKS